MGALRKRFWKAGCLLALFVATLIVGNLFLPAGKAFDSRMYGHDFLPFYTAGQLVRSGRADQLYDPHATKILEHQTCREAGLVIHNEYGAFLNPPFAAAPAALLARWNYPQALAVWTALLLAFLIAAIALLVKMFPPQSTWRTWGLLPLLLFTALPAWQAAIHAQNTFFSLLVLAAAVTLWRNNRPLTAGLTAGLLLFKPQLGAVVAMVLAISQGRRAILGLAITAAALLLTTVWAMPGSLTDYLHRMPDNLRAIQALANYTWQRHVTFLAWWRMLLQGHVGALPSLLARVLALACTAALAGLLASTVWKIRSDPRRLDRLIAASIASMPLLMPYYMDYDLTLLAVAAVLCAIDAIRHGLDKSILFAWVGFYAVAQINPATAGFTPVIAAVPFLAILSVLLIRKARQPIMAQRVQPDIAYPWVLAA
jgi:Glycosyltransferase family 87